MKKLIFLCFSVLCTNFIWSQITVNDRTSVEVGINNSFIFTFTPKSSDYPSTSSLYKLTSWTFSDPTSNMNNSGTGAYSDNSQSLKFCDISKSQSLEFPIKWEDNYNTLTSEISVRVFVDYYSVDSKENKIHLQTKSYDKTFKVNINRILTPTISTPTILDCSNDNVQISASDYGSANSFAWSISNGAIVSGNGSNHVTVRPNLTGNVYANCVVSRTYALPSYTRARTNTIGRAPRTVQKITTANSDYACFGIGKVFQIDNQSDMTSVTWSAPNCSVSTESIVNGKRQVTVTPNAIMPVDLPPIVVTATASFNGGCTATNSITVPVGGPRTTLPGATCSTISAPCSVIATANNNYLNFTLSAPLGNYDPLFHDWEWKKISGNFYFQDNITGQYNASERNTRQAMIYLTGANPTDNPIKFKARVKSECGWGDWTEYVWNDGTTTPPPPPPPVKYFTVSPNPANYYININIIDPHHLPQITTVPIPPVTACLYLLTGATCTNTITLENYSGTLGFMSSGPFGGSLANGTYILKIVYGDYSETHTIIKI